MKMISLIIPVYNKAPFLRRCLDSVAEQKTSSVQVIVVDDGSTDGGRKICDEYSNSFEVYHTENAGVSVARNLGLEKAKGDYISFLDADDLLAPGAISAMAKAAQQGHNVTQFGQFRCKTYESLNNIPYSSPEGFYSFDFIPKYWVMVWNKIYKRSFLAENQIKFREGMQFGEDTLFNAKCILANKGLYHAAQNTVIHCLDDNNSLCRGGANYERIEKLDNALCELADEQTDATKKKWVETAINEHRNSKFYRKHGFNKGPRGSFDVVYFVKNGTTNEELKYSLRSIEKNFSYRNVVFYGGCPKDLKPDKYYKVEQHESTKWQNVRKMMAEAFKNNELTEYVWIFNDDFFLLKPGLADMPPQYNGDLFAHVQRVEQRHGGETEWTRLLSNVAFELTFADKSTLNYEVHKPMLINRAKALQVLKKFPNVHGFRSLYGNYWNIGGESKHDMKIIILDYDVSHIANWEFVSTQDDSFQVGTIGNLIRQKFPNKSKFEI